MRDDVGIVLEVVRQHGDDDLGLVAPALDEERADRAVDQAGDQGLLLGRTAFALEVAARDAAGGVGALLVVHGEREEVDAGLRLLGRRRRWRARWSRRRWRRRRRRPGGRSCRFRARACARPRSALHVGYRTYHLSFMVRTRRRPMPEARRRGAPAGSVSAGEPLAILPWSSRLDPPAGSTGRTAVRPRCGRRGPEPGPEPAVAMSLSGGCRASRSACGSGPRPCS